MTKEEKEKKAQEIEKKMNEIVKEYGNFTNIPLTSDYWSLRNEVQRLRTV